jgi:transposase
MFIKEIEKRNKNYEKKFVYHRLVESYRTIKGPRHRTILNLGTLEIPKEQWKTLADAIEAKLTGQQTFYAADPQIDTLATHYAQLIVQKKLYQPSRDPKEQAKPQYETIDLDSIHHEQCRTLGAEYVGLATLHKLGLDTLFEKLGFTTQQMVVAQLSIIGRLVKPASELQTAEWARHLTALDELLQTNFTHLSHNALYRITDLLWNHKEQIETHLTRKERDLFSLQEKIILYDLTNTYFEGRAKGNKKARRGRSKDKRKGAPLLTLAMVIDEEGFAKTSRILPGNISEPTTLKQTLNDLHGTIAGLETTPPKGVTVVMDAGIASEENLKLVKELGYDYLCVARNKPLPTSQIHHDQLITIKEERDNKIEVELIRQHGESVLFCKSHLKAKKEHSMRTLLQQRFEQDLQDAAHSLTIKGGVKFYEKVQKRMARLQQKHHHVSQYYHIDIEQKGKLATAITWKYINQERADERFSGTYFLRTTRTDLDEKEIWSLYTMLTNLEGAFRSLKSELKLRPINHQKEHRADAHIFITVLAYHLLNTIQTELKKHDIHMQWWRIRERLSSHMRITTSMTTKEGKRLHIRKTSQPESFHKLIYGALGLSYYPLKSKRTEN